MIENEIHNLLVEEVRRRLFREGVPRIRKCLALLTEEEVWRRPNVNSNSAGNLVLHLCGNVRQWVVAGLGGQPDTRQRDQEFEERGPLPVAQLLKKLDDTMSEVEAVLGKLAPEDLVKMRKVQVYEEPGLSILVHAVEHFSYHVGQITWLTKAMKDVDTGYYAGVDLSGP